MSPENKGLLACIKVDEFCVKNLIPCSTPIFEVRYDRIIELNKKLYRVQVKYCDRKSNCSEAYSVNLTGSRNGETTHKGYTENEVDALVVYLPITDKLYWFPIETFERKTAINIRLEPTKNGQKKNIVMAEDFIWECSSVG